MKQNWIRFKPFSFNRGKLEDLISNFIIKKRIKFLDGFFAKRWSAYSINLFYYWKDYMRTEIAWTKGYYDPWPNGGRDFK